MRTKPIPVLTQDEIDRFWSKVDRSGGPDACWVWQGSCYPNGYGIVSHIQSSRLGFFQAHRIAYRINHDKDPINICVCHTCDNHPCCNPKHHFLGTQAVNLADMRAKGRGTSGDTHPNSKVAEDDIDAILLSNEPQHIIGARYDLAQSTISSIRRGKSRKQTGDRSQTLIGARQGVRAYNHKLTDEDIHLIRNSTEMNKTLAEWLNVDPSVISRVRSGLVWKHVV